MSTRFPGRPTKGLRKGNVLSRPAKAVKKQPSAFKKKRRSPVVKALYTGRGVSFWDEKTAFSVDNGTSTKKPPATRLGLRQMSIKICEKVRTSGRLTCDEVADEIFKEEREDCNISDDKNIRRRLYDALNVLDAVDVLAKGSKHITWKGLPDNQAGRLLSEREQRKKQVQDKEEAVFEQLIQQVTYSNLVRHNQWRHHTPFVHSAEKMFVPFAVVSASPSAVIHCDASWDMSDVKVDVDNPFAINDDSTILVQMGFNRTTMDDLQKIIPEDMVEYCLKHDLLRNIISRKRGASALMESEQLYEPQAKCFRRGPP